MQRAVEREGENVVFTLEFQSVHFFFRQSPSDPMAMFEIAQRAQAPPNAIREMFRVAGGINKSREAEGLPPLVSLGIGAPHMYAYLLAARSNSRTAPAIAKLVEIQTTHPLPL